MLEPRRTERLPVPLLDAYVPRRRPGRTGPPSVERDSAWLRLRLRVLYAMLWLFNGGPLRR